MTGDFRIEFTITHRGPDDDDFKEIGFGSSGAWANVDDALHDLASIIEHRQWDTEAGMPDPALMKREPCV